MYSQREFFLAVLSAEGKPCVAQLATKGNQKYFKHEVYDSLDLMLAGIENRDFTTADSYFCISTLEEKSVVDQTGHKRTRIQSNTLDTRVFILDVDIRPEKPGFYKTVDEAMVGLALLEQALNLPKPIIVNSGFGLHVYWPMAAGIPSATWRPIAARFKKAIETIAPELVADGSRVSDSAGVLRIPNSFNLKGGKQTPVEITQWYSDFLDFGVFSATLSRIFGEPQNDEPRIKTGITTTTLADLPPGNLRTVAKNCNWVGNYLANRDKAAEPAWYAILGLVPYLILEKDGTEISGPKLAHFISKGHPNYDEQNTYNKYMQAKQAQNGPSTCARFKGINPKLCEGCPFAATVKTPIQTSSLDRPATKSSTITTKSVDDEGNTKTEKVTIPLPPKPYFRGESGGVYIRVKTQQPDGSWDEAIAKIYDYDIYPTKRYRTEMTESELMEVHFWLPKDGLRKFRLPNGLLADSKSLAKFMSDKGVVTEYGKTTGVTKFLIDYVRHLQMVHAAEIEFSRFGWRDINSAEPKFIVGDGYINKEGVVVPAAFADFLRKTADSVSIKGDLEEWKKGFDVYKTVPDSEPYQLAALLGFAAPLMALTEYSGVLYNMVGHGGAGKSTALKVMTSVWGKPTYTHILPKDTEIAMFNHIGYLNNIPVAFDELTKMDGDKLSDFCLNFTSGRGKMRATRNGTNALNETVWDTIVCATSNTSLYDKLAANRRGYNAEAMRIFEVPIEAGHLEYKSLVDSKIAVLNSNYGQAGREYVNYIIPRLDKIRGILDATMAMITKKGGLRNEERFWGALLACTLVGGKIAKDVLKLHTYDVNKLIDWALGFSKEVRATVQSTISDSVSTLAEFFNSNLNSILRCEGGRPMLNGMQNNMNGVKARVEYEEGKAKVAYISIPAMREYCQHRNIDASWLRRELQDAGILLSCHQQKRLTAGTNFPNINVKVWELNMQHEKLAEITLPEPAILDDSTP